MKGIKSILICGAGIIGKNIGCVFASGPSFQMGIYDPYPIDVEVGICTDTRQLPDKGAITERELSDRFSRISFTDDTNSNLMKNVDLVIEAIFEGMRIKWETFAKLGACHHPDTIFCINSFVISPNRISVELKHREHFVGTHLWNLDHLIPLVGVVKFDVSGDEVVQTVMEVLRSVGRRPVLYRKDVPGFIASRMQHVLQRGAVSIVESGITDAATVDRAVRYSFGLRLPQPGPVKNTDAVDTDPTHNIRDYILQDLEDSHEPFPLLKQPRDVGKTGFKTGEGFQKRTPEQTTRSNVELNEYLIRVLCRK